MDGLDLPLPCLVVQVVSPDASAEYVARLHKGQAACIQRLERLADGRGDGEEGEEGKLDISPVPFFDMEVAGVYPLRYGTKREGLSFPSLPFPRLVKFCLFRVSLALWRSLARLYLSLFRSSSFQ